MTSPVRCGVYVELEGSTLVAAITFWNKRDICAEALKAGDKTPISIEDRVIAKFSPHIRSRAD